MSADWMVTPRLRDLRRGPDPVDGWTKLEVIERDNTPGTWVLTGPARALSVFEAGMGCILTRDDEQIVSGQLWSYDRGGGVEATTGRITETMTLGFIEDNDAFSDRLAWQVPSKTLTGTLSKFTAEHDVRTGPREDLILAYIRANLGAGAVPNRRMDELVLPVSLGRGGAARFTARMNDLGVVVHDLAEAAGLRVRIVHDEQAGTPRLLVVVDEVRDLSDRVRFGPPDTAASGFITSWKYHYEDPKVTRPIAAAGGEGVERLYAQKIDTTAEDLWGRGRERAVDQRQTSDQGEIDAAMDDALAEGAAPTAVEFDVADGVDVRVREHYGVGDVVSVLLDGLPPQLRARPVRELTTTVQAAGSAATETVKVVVGSPGATAHDDPDAATMTRALRAIRTLERST